MVYKKIHDDLYGADCLYFSGCEIGVAQKKANRVFNIQEELSVESNDAAAFFKCTTKDQRNVFVIWIKKSRDIPTIAHEITHLVFEVFKERGIPNSYQNQESFAYYHAYWMEQIITSERKTVFKKKR